MVAAAQSTTQITDTVLNSDGSPFNGTVVITWTGATSGSAPAPYSTSAKIYNGVLNVALVPSVASSSSAFYVATFNSRDGLTSWVEAWQVGPSTSPLTLAQVRIAMPTSTGSSGGTAISIGQVTGLSAYLNAMSTSLNTVSSSIGGFNTTLAGLNTSVSNLTAIVGNLTANAGTSASSAPTFVDAEVPAGTLNGTNVVFTLANTPSPAASVTLFVNGILQLNGTDFSLSNKTVTFASASKPQAGDVIQASYRMGSSGQAGFVDNETPTGAINGSNLIFQTASVPNPTPSLKVYKNGLLLLPNLDYSVSGSRITFSSAATTPGTGDALKVFYRVTTP